jgi:hypothetical protein
VCSNGRRNLQLAVGYTSVPLAKLHFGWQQRRKRFVDFCLVLIWNKNHRVVTMLLFYQVATRLSLTTCWQIVELQDDNKLLEQLVTSVLSSTTLQQVVNKPLTSCQQAGNKQCEHILLTSWNSIATSLLQVWYNLSVLGVFYVYIYQLKILIFSYAWYKFNTNFLLKLLS